MTGFAVIDYPKNSRHKEELKQSLYAHKHTSRIEMYTDGSKTKLGTGAGIAVKISTGVNVYNSKISGNDNWDIYKIKMNRMSSVFTAELCAIESAVNSI